MAAAPWRRSKVITEALLLSVLSHNAHDDADDGHQGNQSKDNAESNVQQLAFSN